MWLPVGRNKSLGSEGLGAFYREPEVCPGWQGHILGTVTASGRFTAAMNAS
jgi:arabinogalactan endo-1,4-beta-galactosidase